VYKEWLPVPAILVFFLWAVPDSQKGAPVHNLRRDNWR